jgi:hypothetical protein
MTYFRMVKTTLSLALSSFTSEFGMGSGGSRSLLSPGKSVCEVLASAEFLSLTTSHLTLAYHSLGLVLFAHYL